jgi:hypothetical protein
MISLKITKQFLLALYSNIFLAPFILWETKELDLWITYPPTHNFVLIKQKDCLRKAYECARACIYWPCRYLLILKLQRYGLVAMSVLMIVYTQAFQIIHVLYCRPIIQISYEYFVTD